MSVPIPQNSIKALKEAGDNIPEIGGRLSIVLVTTALKHLAGQPLYNKEQGLVSECKVVVSASLNIGVHFNEGKISPADIKISCFEVIF